MILGSLNVVSCCRVILQQVILGHDISWNWLLIANVVIFSCRDLRSEIVAHLYFDMAPFKYHWYATTSAEFQSLVDLG